jgi:hypothetical protein
LKSTLQEGHEENADIRETKLLQVLFLKYKSAKGNGYNMSMERRYNIPNRQWDVNHRHREILGTLRKQIELNCIQRD